MSPKETLVLIRTIRNDIDTLLAYHGVLSDEMFHELSYRIDANIKKIEDDAQQAVGKEVDEQLAEAFDL
jgi:hypothetical protein